MDIIGLAGRRWRPECVARIVSRPKEVLGRIRRGILVGGAKHILVLIRITSHRLKGRRKLSGDLFWTKGDRSWTKTCPVGEGGWHNDGLVLIVNVSIGVVARKKRKVRCEPTWIQNIRIKSFLSNQLLVLFRERHSPMKLLCETTLMKEIELFVEAESVE